MNIYHDPLYGDFQLESILVELIKSPPMQRLKGIHQGGASYLVNASWNITRYEHSIGVMLLIRKLHGSLKEQIAGLLHDISHTAFSHVIDLSLDINREDFHESIFHKVVLDSEIPEILERYHYTFHDIFSKNWPLLDREAPFLNADRIDYTLRDVVAYQDISLDACHTFIDSLFVQDDYIVSDSLDRCVWFVRMYKKEVIDFFYNPLNVYGYEILSSALKIALEKKIISYNDLLKTDGEVMSLLLASQDSQIELLLEKIQKDVSFIHTTTEFDIHQKKKLRFIDPLVSINSHTHVSSQLSSSISLINNQILQFSDRGIFLKVIEN